MANTMKAGDLVKAKDWEGKILARLVVKDCGNLVFICTKEEFEAANEEGREPIAVGWPRGDLVA